MNLPRSPRLLAAMTIAIAGFGCSSDTGGSSSNPPTATATPVGTLTGTAATANIGAAGGTLTSADGGLTLTIPAGALGANTSISIQPITNTAWGGTGDAYRLAPNGLTFTSPVTLAFHIAPETLDGTMPELMRIATQGQDGFWYVLKDPTYDSITRTVTAQTSHFSDYSNIAGLQIRPASAAVEYRGTISLRVEFCYQAAVSGDPDLTALVYTCDDGGEQLAPLGTFSNWSVNGIAGGNGSVGSVAGTSSSQQATYRAPQAAPPTNPVAVSVQAKLGGRTYLLVSNITVGTEWAGTGTAFSSIGSGNPSERDRSDFNVTWALNASYEGHDYYVPRGTVTVKFFGDPNCPELSLLPNRGSILGFPQGGQMIIDHTTTPATVDMVLISAAWQAQYTFQCTGHPVQIESITAGGGVAAETGIVLSADGTTITGAFLDPVSGDAYNFTFTRKVPGGP